MPRKTKRPESLPEGSWVFEDDSDEEEDDNDGTFTGSSDEASDLPERGHVATGKPSLRQRMRRTTPPTSGPDEFRPRVSKNSARTQEPQFVMPSIVMDSSSPATSPRRRKPAMVSSRKTVESNGASLPRISSRMAYIPADSHFQNIADHAYALWTEVVVSVVKFSHAVFTHIFQIVKPALAFFAAVWIIFFLGHHLLTSTIARSLAPLCSLPGVSHLDLPFCFVKPPPGPVEFDQLMTVQSAFEDILQTSSGGITLPADMKRSESSIRDLKHVVQYSGLPSRNELVFEFNGFIETAKEASSDLTRFNSRIGRAVDHVISTNRWTLQVIDGVADREASRSSLGKFVSETILFPFVSPHVTERLLMEQYLQHTRTIEEHIAELILEAQALLAVLQNLDDRLDVIHGITTRDGVSIKGSRDELFALLWTKLGGNRSSKKKHDDQLYLLNRVSSYRKVAWDHVSTTMLKLQTIAAGLEDLRERVAAPDVLGARDDIPLRLHIENIQMAVERLDSQRSESRKLEGNYHQRMLGKGNDQLFLP